MQRANNKNIWNSKATSHSSLFRDLSYFTVNLWQAFWKCINKGPSCISSSGNVLHLQPHLRAVRRAGDTWPPICPDQRCMRERGAAVRDPGVPALHEGTGRSGVGPWCPCVLLLALAVLGCVWRILPGQCGMGGNDLTDITYLCLLHRLPFRISCHSQFAFLLEYLSNIEAKNYMAKDWVVVHACIDLVKIDIWWMSKAVGGFDPLNQ